MPSKNVRKVYVKNGYYHLYNRGVEKRNIFVDEQDYSVFLLYLKEYLTPKNEKELFARLSEEGLSWLEKEKIKKLLRLNNFSEKIDLLCYALMPNHFHFLVKQSSLNAIDSFSNSLMTRFVMYFNKKYRRVGPLFQGVYKAVFVDSESQLLHLSRYIHRNPTESEEINPQKVYTSLPEFLGQRKTDWVKPSIILNYFSKKNDKNSYNQFVQETNNVDVIDNLTLE